MTRRPPYTDVIYATWYARVYKEVGPKYKSARYLIMYTYIYVYNTSKTCVCVYVCVRINTHRAIRIT